MTNRVLKNPAYVTGIKRQVLESSKELYEFSDSVLRINVKEISDEKLLNIFEQHGKIIHTMVGWGVVSTVMELPFYLFTKYAENFLNARVNQLRLKRSAGQFFQVLSTIELEGIQKQQQLDLLTMLSLLQKKGLSGKLKKTSKTSAIKIMSADVGVKRKIEAHTKKFSWSNYNYNGPAFTEDWVAGELIEMLKAEKQASKELALHKKEKAARLGKIAGAEKELKLTPKEKQLFQALRDTSTMKIVRRDALTYSFYRMEPLLKEFAKRANISIILARSVFPGQHRQVLQNPRKLKPQLVAQRKHTVYDCTSTSPNIITDSKAKQLVKKVYKEESIQGIVELKGQIACLGYAKGRVRVVNVLEDMRKMQKGDILVSIATIPEIVPAMKKAAAIVTDMGGVTSHAAIVSRELNIPCVLGLRIATRVFKDGDLVEVDANKGIVKLLK